MISPDHEHELRREFHESGSTGFCFICLRNFPFCQITRYMTVCIKFKDHEGLHQSEDKREWSDTDPGCVPGRKS